MKHDYRYTIKDLITAFKKAGYPVTAAWIYRQEAKGNLILPRSTTNFKKSLGTRRIGAVRIFTETQIASIITAFLPGGPGYYSYR